MYNKVYLGDALVGFVNIDDTTTSGISTYSSSKIATLLNGKANTSHTHTLLSNLYTTRPASADVKPTGSGGMSKFLATSSMTTNKPKFGGTTLDAHVIDLFWDSTVGWDCQIAVSDSDNVHMAIRGQNSGTWGAWRDVLDSNNYSSYALPKSGGTLTGDTTLTSGKSLIFENRGYHASCSTGATTAAKVATYSNYTLPTNDTTTFTMYMTTSSTVKSAITLNVNNTGAKAVRINGTATSASVYSIPSGYYQVTYNATNSYYNLVSYYPQSAIRFKGYSNVVDVLRMYTGDENGHGVALGSGGLTVIGSGESLSSIMSGRNPTDENLILASDQHIYFYSNCQTFANRIGMVFDSSGILKPVTNKGVSLGSSDYRFNNIYGSVVNVDGTDGFTYSGIGKGTDDTYRNVWFSHSSTTGRPVYDTDFQYNPSKKSIKLSNCKITYNSTTGTLDIAS